MSPFYARCCRTIVAPRASFRYHSYSPKRTMCDDVIYRAQTSIRSAQQEESNLYECPSFCRDWWNISVLPRGTAQSASGLSTVETFLCPLVVGNVGTAPTIRTTRHELPLICAIFFSRTRCCGRIKMKSSYCAFDTRIISF